MIAAQLQLWQARQRLTTEWLTLLTRRATQLQDELSRLEAIQERWRQTQAAAQAANAPVATLQQIDAVLTDLAKTDRPSRPSVRRCSISRAGLPSRWRGRGPRSISFAQAERAAMGGC